MIGRFPNEHLQQLREYAVMPDCELYALRRNRLKRVRFDSGFILGYFFALAAAPPNFFFFLIM